MGLKKPYVSSILSELTVDGGLVGVVEGFDIV